MGKTISAIYQDGVLKPLEPLDLPERQQVQLTVSMPADEHVQDPLSAWQTVYQGLSAQEVADVERIALDRSEFFRPRE